ncbi:MAG: hypothetical protein EXR29_12190 [Betaproteobacteria bacterium]|nr:hypothetical protein [Betaproteobacteria bacterium]
MNEAEMQKIIDADQRELFDVLARVAWALEPLTRGVRAGRLASVVKFATELPFKPLWTQQLWIKVKLSSHSSPPIATLSN